MNSDQEIFETFEEAYAGTAAPWEIGRPQQAYVELMEENLLRGSILDIGCGTGENALYFAQKGHEVWGIDITPAALQKAQKKSAEREVDVTFQVADALALQGLGKTFETITDSGLFHSFSEEERGRLVKSLASVLKPGGTYFVLCLSDRLPIGRGPEGVSQAVIYETFQQAWKVNFIRESQIVTKYDFNPPAWLASITYQG